MSQEAAPNPRPTKITGAPRWLGLAYEVRTDRGTIAVRPNWMVIASLSVVLVVLGLLGKSALLYYILKNHKKFDDVSFVDCLAYPINLGGRDIRQQLGDYYVTQASKAWKEQRYMEGFNLVRQGLQRAPDNVEGRKMLAMIYLSFQPSLAKTLLDEGLVYAGDDLEYLRLVAQTYLMLKEDAGLAELLNQRLPADLPETDYERVVCLLAMRVAMNLGRLDEAERIYLEKALGNNMEGVLYASQILSLRGRESAVPALLRSFADRYQGQAIDPVLSALMHNHIDHSRDSEALEVAFERCLRDPMDWRPRVELLPLLKKANRTERLQRETEDLLRQFKSNELALAAIGQYAADAGDLRVARRVYESALEGNFNLAIFSLLFIESHLTAKEFTQAVGLCEELVKENPTWLADHDGVFRSLQSLAYFGAGNPELGRLYLNQFIQARNVDNRVLVSVADRCRQIGYPEPARLLLNEVVKRDPKDEQASMRLIEVALQVGEFREIIGVLDPLLGQRRPGYELFGRLVGELSSDRFIYSPERDALIERLQVVLQESRASERTVELATLPALPKAEPAPSTEKPTS